MDGIGWGASAMGAAQQRLTIATNNLANAQTDGFVRLVARGQLTRQGVRVHAVSWRGLAALKPTRRPFDLALVGPGSFFVRSPGGRTTRTRLGAFERSVTGTLVDTHGNALLGRNGPLRVSQTAEIDAYGNVREQGRIVDHVAHSDTAHIQSGWLESSSVDAITEMINVMSAQRSFETAEKVVAAIDATHQKAAQNVATLS